MAIRLRGCRAALAAFLVAFMPSPGQAAGFAIFEQGARGMGFAGAFTAQANDPSAIFHNAAGIGFLKGKQLYLGGTLIHPSTNFTGSAPFPGEGVTERGNVGVLIPPAAYYTQRVSERLVLGVGFDTPFGLKTQWAEPETYSGRYVSQLAELKGFSLNPTLAYQLADRLSVGVGVDVRLSSVTLQRRVPFVNPFTQKVVDVAEVRLESNTNTGIGFNVGLLAKPSESLSLGIAYRHKVKIDYDGSATFTKVPTGNAQLDTLVAGALPGTVGVSTGIEFPGLLSGGVAYTWNDWTIEGDVNWYQWSTFDQLDLVFEGRSDLDRTIIEKYKSSMQYRVGLERRLNDIWRVRGGYFFDQSPAPTESISPLLPDADRHGFCVGGSWQSGRVRVDAASWYVLSKERSTEGSNRDRYDGTYKSKALTFGLSLGYSF